jgi:hypothetical protein
MTGKKLAGIAACLVSLGLGITLLTRFIARVRDAADRTH